MKTFEHVPGSALEIEEVCIASTVARPAFATSRKNSDDSVQIHFRASRLSWQEAFDRNLGPEGP
jgi:hypothetical protein